MVLAIIKLGSLLVRTVSKPVANQIKYVTAFHPKLRGIIIDLAQGHHRLHTVMQRTFYRGSSTVKKIEPLNEEKAVEAATNLLGELFVFSVGGLGIVCEIQRSARTEAKKEERRKQESEEMKRKTEELSEEVKLLEQKLEQVEKLARQKNVYRLWNWRANDMPSNEKFGS